MNIRSQARKAFPILSALALMIAASASAQSFLTSPFAVDNAGEKGAPSVNPAVQTASVVFEIPVGYFYRVIVDTHGTGGVGSPDGVFDRNDDWTWQGTADVQLVPAQPGGQNSLAIRIDWDGTSQWDSSALVGDGTYDVQVEIGFSDAGVRDGTGVKEQVQIEIDTKAPVVSFSANSFSPNADGQKDAALLAFASSETLDSVEVSIAAGPTLNAPSAAFSTPYNKAGAAFWDGTDITGAALPDGEYTLQIRAADRAGNAASSQRTIQLDTKKPAFSTLTPVNGALLNAPLAQIEASLDALGGSPIDVQNLSIQIANAAGEPVAGALEIDSNGGSMRFVFASPLSTTAENGIYNVTASIMDEAGNAASRSARFMLDTVAPLVGQAYASDGAVVPGFIGMASDTLTAAIAETGSGIDFGSAQATLTAPSGALFPVVVELSETTGGGQIELTYANLAEEGVYTMQVSGARDLAGNAAAARSFSFIYDETPPRIESLTPFDLRPGALTRANAPFDSVVLTLSDNLTDIDFTASSILVRGPNGVPLLGTLYNDGESTVSFQLRTPLSVLGADDGQYDVSVRAADAAGNAVSIASRLILDTQAPRILSMTPAPNSVLSGGIEQIALTLAPDTTGLDISAVTATLLSPSGSAVPTALRVDSDESLRLEFAPLRADGTDDGTYRVVWNLTDLAGNSVSETREFTLSSRKPYLVSSEPADEAYVNRWSQFTAQLGDDSGAGINFDTLQISISDPDGQPAAGRASHDGAQTIAFTADAPAPNNGSADGVYAVSIYVENKQGGASVIETSFTLDTAPPSLLSVWLAHGAVLDISKPLIGSISVSDEGSGIDYDGSTIQTIGPDDAVIPALVQYDGAGIFLITTEPLTAFGRYRIETTLRDRAGNVSATSQTVFEIRQAEGVVTSVQPAHRSYVDSLSSASVELSGATSESIIELIGPDGQPVVGTASFAFDVLTLTLETPLAEDGRDDGDYTLRVTPVDAADIAGPTLQYSFTMDTQAPLISELQPANIFNAGGYVSAEFMEASVLISDAVSGVDLSASSIRVVNSGGATVRGVQSNDGAGSLMWRAGAPLADGRYTVHVKAVDRAGHTASMRRSFALDTQAPWVVSSSVAFNATVTEAIKQIGMRISHGEGSSLDLSASEIALNGPSGPVPLQKLLSGSALILTFPPLNESGGYTLSVRLSDEAGNAMSEAALTPFTVTLEGPAVVSLTINGAPPSAYVSSLTEARAQFADRGGVGLDFTEGGTSLVVTGPNGSVDGLTLEEGSGLVWRPVTTLDADGSYTVSASAVDKRGRRSATLSHTFILDTQAPSVVSSSLAFDEELTSPINSVQLTLSDGRGVGVDLSASQISLNGPGGSIPLQKSFNGRTLTLVFPEINENGSYTLSVRLTDEAGNAMSEAALTPFTVTLDGPAVVSLTINGAPPSAYVSSLTEARAQFADRGGVGLDFTEGGTSLVVTGPNGAVDGLTLEEGSGLVWRPVTTLDADGSYTVSASAVDKRGRKSATLSHTFILDTQAPSVVSSSLAFDEELTSPINTVQLTLSDGEGVGVDLSASQISLSGPGGSIPLQKSFDGETLTLLFPEINENGSYTLSVRLTDEAGNAMSEAALTPFTVTLDGPAVVSLTINGAPPSAYVSSLTEARAQFADRGGVGLDFTEGGTSLVVTGPNGAVDGLTLEEGSGLVWRPVTTLDADGSYTVSASAVDKRGRKSATLSHTFILDTQAPSVVSSSLAFDEELTSPINSVQLTLSDGEGVGVDLSASQISLSGPGGSIPLQKSFDGETLTLLFPEINENGSYTLSVRLTDEAGNAMSESALTPFTVTLDGPAVVSLTINGAPPSAYVSSLTEARAQFADRGGVGLDFTEGGTSLVVTGPNGAVDGLTLEEGSGLVWRPVTTLDADGSYTVTATAVDKRGRTSEALSHTFILDTQAPSVVSSSLAFDEELTSPINSVQLTLSDGEGVGVDLSASQISLSGPGGSIPLQKSFDGETLTLIFPEINENGSYTLSVRLTDEAGNAMSEAALTPFTVTLDGPAVVSLTINGAPPSAYVSTLTEARAQFADRGGVGLDFTDGGTSLIVTGPNGAVDGLTLEEGSGLVWRPVTTLDADGSYTVTATAVDKRGRTSEALSHTFILDTQAPSVVSSSLAFDEELTSPINSVQLTLSDGEGVGVDLSASQISLSGPGGSIPLQKSFDGETLTLFFPEINENGSYTLSVRLTDEAGNAMSEAALTPFTMTLDGPVVVSVTVNGAAPTSYATSFTEAGAVFADRSGAGLDFADGATRIQVIGPRGDVNGTLAQNGDALTWTPDIPIRENGIDDGTYTVSASAVDMTGQASPTESYAFMLDTQAPRLTSALPLELLTSLGYLNSPPSVISVTLADAASGVDLSVSSIAVFDSGGTEVAGVRTDDGSGTIIWTAAEPLADDGSSDGVYTVQMTAADRAGHTIALARPFTLDTQHPTVASSSVAFDAELNAPINSIQLELTDGEGVGVDLSASSFALSGPGGSVPIQKTEDGDSVELVFPALKTNGVYTLSATLADKAGNAMAQPALTPFTVRLSGPAVVGLSVNGATPPPYASALTEARADFEDRGSVGLDFTDAGSSLQVTGPRGGVSGVLTADGDALVWTPAIPLRTDGSDDGTYTVSAAAVDMGGRASPALTHTFILDTQAPRVVSSSPVDASLPTNYVSASFSVLEASVADIGPAGLEAGAMSIRLIGPGGEVPSEASYNEDGVMRLQLNSPLPTNGSGDGVYTLEIGAVDRAGNALSVSSGVVYDTQPPALTASTPADGSIIDPTARKIALQLRDSVSGVDPAASALTLTSPSGAEIPGTTGVSIDGENSTVQFTFEKILTEVGDYVLAAELVDRAGNRRLIELSFYNASNTPTVIQTVPDTRLAETAYAEIGLSEVSALLREAPGSGISTAPGVSTIQLIDPQGNPVSGVQSSRGGNTLVLTLGRALRGDGSDDGTYQIEVTPANAAGIQGTMQTFTFVYDSQPPEIGSSIGTFFPQSEFEQSGDAIAGFYVDLLDDTSGVDWENVDETWMSLENADGETAAATVTGSSLLQILQIVFLTPLASDGSQDGIYTLNIRALDKAGNETTASFQFLVDLTAPAIDAASLTVNGLTIVTDANETGYPTSVNSETGVEIAVNVADEGAGVDLARSGIVVTAPDGSQVNGTLRQNNLDRLIFESGALTREGVYSVSVTAVGIDFSGLGVQPESVLGASFLYEKTAPTAAVTSSPGNAVFESEPAHLTGTAVDEPQEGGEGSPPVPASGVALVEIGGVGPDGEELEWTPAEDESPDAQNPWAQWSSDFLPSRSGTYRVLVRVTDRAGNSAVVDAGMYEFTTALTFKGPVYVWPNPLSRSRGDSAHFSFETNQADRAEWRLSVYTVAGALVYSASGQAERERQANSQSATWNLRNGAGQAVASGLYVFKLEIDDGQSVFRKMGRLLVVK